MTEKHQSRGKSTEDSLLDRQAPIAAGLADDEKRTERINKRPSKKKGKATACVCENYICNRPVNNIEDFEKIFSSTERKKD